MNLYQRVALGLVVVGTLAVAQNVTRTLSLSVGNKPSTQKAYVIGNEVYVPVSSLKAFNISATVQGSKVRLSAQGGAAQTAALEGCIGETLFNGVLRATLVSFSPRTEGGKTTGWTAVLEFRNGTNQSVNLNSAGSADGTNFAFLGYEDSTTFPYPDGGRTKELDREQEIPPGGALKLSLEFTPDVPDRKPIKLLVTSFKRADADAALATKLVPDPGFRFKLNCPKK
jgi:hypothetical protein